MKATFTFASLLVSAGVIGLIIPCFADAPVKPAATVSAVYCFSAMDAGGTNQDGATPTSLILSSNGGLIGTARSGGPNGTGTIFEISPARSFTTVYGFSGLYGYDHINADGATPVAALTLGADGRYYGAASAGGAAGQGTIFELDSAGKLTTLYSFSQTAGILNSNSDGALPSAPLIEVAGDLYGVASDGGEGGTGTIFRISPAGKFEKLYSFSLSTDMATNSDGAQPLGRLVAASDGSLYGTAAGFGPGGAGSIYKVTPGGQFTLVRGFMQLDDNKENPDGAAPYAGLTRGPNGDFYGTALLGGRYGTGSIFCVASDGRFGVLHAFSKTKGSRMSNSDGAFPDGPLLLASDGCLYGVTRNGGKNGTGTIFRITPDGAFETLYAFSGLDKKGSNPDGASPGGPLVDGSDGRLYGTAAAGGSNGTGTVFAITISTSAPKIKAS